jgi:hypothetical protein
MQGGAGISSPWRCSFPRRPALPLRSRTNAIPMCRSTRRRSAPLWAFPEGRFGSTHRFPCDPPNGWNRRSPVVTPEVAERGKLPVSSHSRWERATARVGVETGHYVSCAANSRPSVGAWIKIFDPRYRRLRLPRLRVSYTDLPISREGTLARPASSRRPVGTGRVLRAMGGLPPRRNSPRARHVVSAHSSTASDRH